MSKCRERERTISFRLGSPYLERLEERSKGTSLSRHQVARLALVSHLEESAVHRCADDMRSMRRDLEQMLRLLARMAGSRDGETGRGA